MTDNIISEVKGGLLADLTDILLFLYLNFYNIVSPLRSSEFEIVLSCLLCLTISNLFSNHSYFLMIRFRGSTFLEYFLGIMKLFQTLIHVSYGLLCMATIFCHVMKIGVDTYT